MQVLRWTFKILTFCGCWRPLFWSLRKKQFYDIYTILVFLLVHTFTLSLFFDIIFTVDNSDQLIDNVYILMGMVISCFKMFSLLMNRNNIFTLCNTLIEKPCKPMDAEELNIQTKFEEISEFNTIYYAVLIESGVGCFIFMSLFTDLPKKRLTFRGWLPYDYSSWSLFCFTYVHQAISTTAGTLLNVACDTLICGLFVCTSSQIEILEHRLNKVVQDKKYSLRNCIYHHIHIYRFACMINKEFKMTLFIQFLSSMLMVCFNLYQLAKTKPFSAKFIQLTVYMICMLYQIFFYCWYGNEVKLKSQQIINKIFEIEWPLLNNRAKNVLLIIMKRAMIPIEFTSAHLVTVNLDSFLSLLKTSYSVYNLLQQSQVYKEG